MNRITHMPLSFALVVILLFIAGCSPIDDAAMDNVSDATTEAASASTAEPASEPSSEKPIIAVSIVPQKTFAEAGCGDLAEVIAMVPPGNSPGNYEPTPQQMEEVSDAVLYFSIGIPTEQANILPDLPNTKVVSLPEAVAAVYPDRTFETGGRDPHIWLSPRRAEVMVETIAQEMSELDEANSETYQKNAIEYIAKLKKVDHEIADIFAGIEDKDFIIYHPAFGYLADDYGLTMHSLQQSGKDATPQHQQELIDLAKEKGITTVYIQAEFDNSQAEQFAEEIGGEAVTLSPLSADYIENLEYTARTIAENLQ